MENKHNIFLHFILSCKFLQTPLRYTFRFDKLLLLSKHLHLLSYPLSFLQNGPKDLADQCQLDQSEDVPEDFITSEANATKIRSRSSSLSSALQEVVPEAGGDVGEDVIHLSISNPSQNQLADAQRE